MTCAHCEDMAERVAWLEGELSLQLSASDVHTLCRRFKMRPQAAQMVLAMYRAKGRVMSNLQLWETMPQVRDPRRDDDRDFKMLDVQICSARKALGADAIETAWGKGRALSPVGMERVAAALGGAA